ncbi:hypothetical protein [Methanosarcina mazei]|nr:hypothetical protein [Methanosarcina mazei]
MTTEEKQKINVWIPGSLWKQIGSLRYESLPVYKVRKCRSLPYLQDFLTF